MTSKFSKILLVKKTTKYERMKQSGRTFSPYIENVLMKVWEEAANVHISIADFCYQQLKTMGKEVVMKKDLDLRPEDVKDKDILISLGGDGTYLRTAGIIENSDTPILGLNTDPSRSIGFLCNNKIYNDMKEKQVERIFDNLEKENFEYFYRQRINFTMEAPLTGETTSKLVLNEIFAAEKDTGKTSIYRLFVDNQDLGKFKSSGIIISTGTGSSGWLFSARRITQSDVRTILNYLGNGESIELVEEHFAKTISKQTIFPPEEEKMYYFVREGYLKDPKTNYNRHSEGYARHIKYLSELIEGRVYIDGYYTKDIGLGDVFQVDTSPDYRLKCIRFLL